MSKLPAAQHDTAAAIYSHYERVAAAKSPRAHLGASVIGQECARQLWLAFRWAEHQSHPGERLRLFDTGKREEPRVLYELRAIGCEVSEGPAPGQQWRLSAVRGHFGGSMDAAVRGLPEAPKTWHVLEIKTHNAKSFKELAKGVQVAKPVHYAQMQAYMHLSGMQRALYFAVNKDSDALHIERVEYDEVAARKLMDRAAWIIDSPEPPAKIAESADHWQCKGCAFVNQCHGTQAPLPTCRTCAHATPVEDGAWRCEWWGQAIPLEAQAKGCEQHRYIPATVASFAELAEHDELGNVTTWRNRLEPSRTWRQPEFTSWEMRAADSKALLGDEKLDELKREFEGDAQVGWDQFPSDLPWLESNAKPGGVDAAPLAELYKGAA